MFPVPKDVCLEHGGKLGGLWSICEEYDKPDFDTLPVNGGSILGRDGVHKEGLEFEILEGVLEPVVCRCDSIVSGLGDRELIH